MKKILLSMLAITLISAGCTKVDSDPTQVTKTFEWTATGDDGSVGTAYVTILKYSTDSLQLKNDWASCIEVTGLPTPAIAGTIQSVEKTLTLESGTTYYFAMKVYDEPPWNNESVLSNIISLTPPDTRAPLGITDLHFK